MDMSFADLDWAGQQLKRLTYKPGWTLEMQAPIGAYGEPGVLIEFIAYNSYRPGEKIKIRSQERIPLRVIQFRDEALFVRHVQDALYRVERHESQEWLKRDGVIFDNPHK